jgi:hypothetical protein
MRVKKKHGIVLPRPSKNNAILTLSFQQPETENDWASIQKNRDRKQ